MNDIIFNRGRGGLGRSLLGKDHISGLVIEMANENIPAPILAEGLYKEIFSVQDAEDLLIEYSENTDNLELDTLKYHIDNIFEVNQKAVVHLCIADTTNSGTLADSLKKMQYKAKGEVRQSLLVSPSKDFAVGDLAPLQAACDVLESEHMPVSVVYSPNFFGVSLGDVDLRGQDNKNVSVIASQDGNGTGNRLFEAYSKTFSAGGTLIGVLSSAKVHENVGWVGKFNVNKNSTNEYDVIKFADGRLFEDVSRSETDTLGDKRYIFLRKHIGLAGSYFNDSHTAISESSDYAYIENNRTIDKAVRQCREFLLPSLNSPLYVNENGTLSEDTIASFKNDTDNALEDMQRRGEVSSFQTLIDPEQDVLSTSKLAITIKIVPVGVARNIVVNIGFAVNLS